MDIDILYKFIMNSSEMRFLVSSDIEEFMTGWNLALSCSFLLGHSLEEYQMLIMFMLETAFRARNSKDDPERLASFLITIR